MKSLILTKVHSIALPFKDQVTEITGEGDFDFLEKFVNYLHPKRSEIITNLGYIDAHTLTKSFRYRVFPKYVMRVDLSNSKKKFYKIS